ncbi:homocysteine S-methyltransferase family protein [Paragemmobacter straminiformis]|uniref:Homocysteine S-methyltransferase family protein n=1 Tax=Paragemmobacter straminiformis TaxID=2045119 RepID=A0A842I820_9RHOB|nr:homocysteine S-methyltransferase family protein [Gemmobacter straminiformis]MBC2835543.1 homocysteine S-methyltransferase family protein [Gemmobacter straminiformis]
MAPTALSGLIETRRPWLADGGLETDLIYNRGFDLPDFAAFTLLGDARGEAALGDYFDGFLSLARANGTGFVLDTATWRAGQVWGERMGLDHAAIATANARATDFARTLRDRWPDVPTVINGVIGPAGDGYRIDQEMSAWHARMAHAVQIEALALAGVDLVTAMTMTYVTEAIGIAGAAAAVGLPCVISFTVETDGRLPSGQPLDEAIYDVEQLETPPLWYMVNCAHPEHFAHLFDPAQDWTQRIGGLRANASRASHAVLDSMTSLDDGDPQDFGALYGAVAQALPNLRLIGGCCGTDHRHISAAGETCLHHGTARQARA